MRTLFTLLLFVTGCSALKIEVKRSAVPPALEAIAIAPVRLGYSQNAENIFNRTRELSFAARATGVQVVEDGGASVGERRVGHLEAIVHHQIGERSAGAEDTVLDRSLLFTLELVLRAPDGAVIARAHGEALTDPTHKINPWTTLNQLLTTATARVLEGFPPARAATSARIARR
jgi:hypothetical protein